MLFILCYGCQTLNNPAHNRAALCSPTVGLFIQNSKIIHHIYVAEHSCVCVCVCMCYRSLKVVSAIVNKNIFNGKRRHLAPPLHQQKPSPAL